jgi:hypothetical protein
MSPFQLQVCLSFLIAGSLIAALTLFAEKLGSRLGGLIANLPSNILVTMIFISLAQGTGFVVDMTPAISVGMLVDTFFLLVMVMLLNYGIWAAMTGSLLTWFVLAILASVLPAGGLWLNTAIYLLVTLAVYLYAEHGLLIPTIGRSGKKYNLPQIFLRAVFAGGIVAGVVMISHYAPPYLTGIIGTFPAVLFSSMVILYRNQGAAFARATGKVMILSSTNIVIYAAAVHYSFPMLGITAGTAVSFLTALAWIWMIRKIQPYIDTNK